MKVMRSSQQGFKKGKVMLNQPDNLQQGDWLGGKGGREDGT